MTDPTSPPALATFTVVQANVETDTGGTVVPTSGGVITFTPSPREVVSTLLDADVTLTPVTGTFVNGVLCTTSTGTPGITLVDNVDLGLAELRYKVVYQEMGTLVPLVGFSFLAPGTGAEVDLNTVQRLQQ